MTIQTKDGLGAYEAILPEPDLPSYSEGSTVSTAGPGSYHPARPATNFLQVNQTHQSLNGSYLVDTSIRPPAALLDMPTEEPKWLAMLTGALGRKEKPNAIFRSDYGSVKLQLAVRGGSTARIDVESGHSSCHVVIDGREIGTTLNLSISAGSTIRISLPRDFNGLVKGGCSGHGRVLFSEALNARTTTFAEDQSNSQGGRYFIGDWTQARQPSSPVASGSGSTPAAGDETWKGDVLNVHSKYSDVKLETYEEYEAARIEAVRKKANRAGFDGWLSAVLEETGKVFVAYGDLFLTCFNPGRHDTSFVPANSAI